MEQLQALVGQVCRDFRLMFGGSLILYLGDRPDGRLLSAWRLHVDTAWRVDGPLGPVVGSLDACCEGQPPEWVFRGLNALVGRSVEAVAVGSPVRELQVTFAGAYRLSTFAQCVDESDGWEARRRDGLRVAARTLTEVVEYREEPDEDTEPDGAADPAS
ncbi:MAG: hypothetical protein ACRC1K_14355 [Planctomycetia bacterium]